MFIHDWKKEVFTIPNFLSIFRIMLIPVYVFIFAAGVEIGQYFDLVALLGLEDNRILSIALGRTFSWLDLGCYAVGCAAAYFLARLAVDSAYC